MASNPDDARDTTGNNLGQRDSRLPTMGETSKEGGAFTQKRAIAQPEGQTTSHKLTTPNKLAHVDIGELLERYQSGTPIPMLAAELGVHKSALSRRFRAVAGDEWSDLKEDHYETLLDEGLIAVRAAEDDLNLARARESYLRRVEWRASVEHPRWQQQRPSTAIQVNGDGLQVNVVSYSRGNDAGKAEDMDDDASQVIDAE